MTKVLSFPKKLSLITIVLITAVLFVVSSTYIVFSVLHPLKSNMVQLSRIDFGHSLNENQIYQIQEIIGNYNAIQTNFINRQDGILVYTYNIADFQSNTLITAFQDCNNSYLQPKPYIVTAKQCITGCPMSTANTSLFAKVLKKVVAVF
jgi:hypothetical protein